MGTTKFQIDFNLIDKNLLIDEAGSNIDKDELFGAFIILALLVERNYKNQKWIKKSLKKKLILGYQLGDIFRGRAIGIANYTKQINTEIEQSEFSDIQKEIIWK